MILGIDPGTTETGYCLVSKATFLPLEAGKVSNDQLFESLPGLLSRVKEVTIEGIQSYGQAFGRTVIDTCYIIGRIQQVCIDHQVWCHVYPRPEYARAICGTVRTNDAILRRALITRFGEDKKGGPLYLLKGATDKRSAFAVAVYHLDVGRFQSLESTLTLKG
jgi:Holliday junction resolvasome RuvABC endonuclease subunit